MHGRFIYDKDCVNIYVRSPWRGATAPSLMHTHTHTQSAICGCVRNIVVNGSHASAHNRGACATRTRKHIHLTYYWNLLTPVRACSFWARDL